MFNLKLIGLATIVIVALGYLGYSQYRISSLQASNEALEQSLSVALLSNEAYEKSIVSLQEQYKAITATLDTIHKKQDIERTFVKNAKIQSTTCIDAINTIYSRMQQLQGSLPTDREPTVK